MTTPTSKLQWDTVRTWKMDVPGHVVHRALAQETVLLNISTSTYHAVDEVGARFFEVLQDAPSLQAATDTLAREYGESPERIADDLVTFLEQLQERQLIELRPVQA